MINYNIPEVKTLFYELLRENSNNYLPNSYPNEFDPLPEHHEFNDASSISIIRYDQSGNPIAICIIRERYLKLIVDKELTSENHEFNLFRKYAEVFSIND